MAARWLTDEYDLYYDSGEIFTYAVSGEAWTDRWQVSNRSVQVGDIVFIVNDPGGKNDLTVGARGRVVAADPDEQLRMDEADSDLSPAYCDDDFDIDDQEPLFVCFELDSVVHPDRELSLGWLADGQLRTRFWEDPEDSGIRSGDIVDEAHLEVLTRRWEEHVGGLIITEHAVRLD